jgi:two-component system, response regulator YesN
VCAMKVLIADDEFIICQWFRMTLQPHADRFRIVGEAHDGAQALALCQSELPDVVVTDIKMPVMNGLELIRALKAAHPQVKIVILSAYDDFRYAKEALRLGASDYLLKPEIKDSDLLQVLDNLQQELREQENRRQEYREMRESIHDHMTEIRAAFLKRLVDGLETDPAQVRQKLQQHQVLLEERNLYVLLLALDNVRRETLSAADRETLAARLPDRLHDLLQAHLKNGAVFRYAEDRYVAVVSARFTSSKTVREVLYHAASNMQHAVKDLIRLTASAGISSFSNSFTELPVQLGEAETALQKRFYAGENSVLFYSDLGAGRATPAVSIAAVVNEVAQAINAQEFDRARARLESLFNRLRDEAPPAIADVRLYLADLIRTLVHQTRRVTKVAGHQAQLMETFEREAFLDGLRRLTLGVLQEAAAAARSQVPAQQGLVEKAVAYLHEHYAEDLSLQEVAAHVNLSPSYFCRLFKQEVGMNFHKYLIQLRIARAKELLYQDAAISAGDVAQQVGYPNASYFSRLFKKVAGLTASEYRLKGRSGEGAKEA